MGKDSSVLLVDSSPTLLLLERTLLARRGWKISSAASAAEARAEIDRETPTLILSADQLPDGSGHDLCRHVRGNDLTKHVPFLFVVGRRDDKAIEQCREAGGNEIVFKPLKGNEVDFAINQVLGLAVRRWDRRIFHTLVSVSADGDDESSSRLVNAVNFSPDGLAIETNSPDPSMAVGSKIRILFYVPNHHEPITGDAEIVWQRPSGTRTRYGAQFGRLVPGGIQRIAAFGGFGANPG